MTSNPFSIRRWHDASEPRRITALCWSVMFNPSTLPLKDSDISKIFETSVPFGGSTSAVRTNFPFSKRFFKLIKWKIRFKIMYGIISLYLLCLFFLVYHYQLQIFS